METGGEGAGGEEDSALGGRSFCFLAFLVLARAAPSVTFSDFSFFTSGSTSIGSGLGARTFGASLGFSFFAGVGLLLSFLAGFSSSTTSLLCRDNDIKGLECVL